MFLTRIFYGIAYFIVLIYEIIKSTIDVTIRIIKGGKIDPVVVDIDTVLERPISQTILANSITLTPGTLSIDLDSGKKIIKVAIIAPREKKDVIPFEPYIKKMLE
ncbi:MAG: Na+/H+ antiporter subunit E [Methanobacteriaceae archaeon]|jgi:energy-converting hydrogenase B subunit A|nr:Na+/H+ antiporter subunit E [Candidatus Methanorudis spinitermitis]